MSKDYLARLLWKKLFIEEKNELDFAILYGLEKKEKEMKEIYMRMMELHESLLAAHPEVQMKLNSE